MSGLAKVGFIGFNFSVKKLKSGKVQNLGFLKKFSQFFSQKTVSISCFSS